MSTEEEIAVTLRYRATDEIVKSSVGNCYSGEIFKFHLQVSKCNFL